MQSDRQGPSSPPTLLSRAPHSHPDILLPALSCLRSFGSATIMAADRIFADIIDVFMRGAGAAHRQHDAQEFMHYLLDQMHEVRIGGRIWQTAEL